MEKLVYLLWKREADDIENVPRVLADIAEFSDLEQMNTAPMSEWIIKSCWGPLTVNREKAQGVL